MAHRKRGSGRRHSFSPQQRRISEYKKIDDEFGIDLEPPTWRPPETVFDSQRDIKPTHPLEENLPTIEGPLTPAPRGPERK